MPLSVVGLLLAASVAGAEESYEDRLLAWGLGQRGRQVEPHPAGKQIEELLVASEDVFAPSDPWPELFNLIHVRTRDEVVRREILLQVGDHWDEALVAETERNE